jgi:2,4-dienoyl-CoA reductase-like NADH-dependent reductase (Old Yellow Enzyme family)
LDELIDNYDLAAKTAHEVGYQFVDVKACHGYLLHEFLSARLRPGRYGGNFDGRMNLLLSIIRAVQTEVPDLVVMVRLSMFDTPPFVTSRETGRPMDYESLLPYEIGFGVNNRDPMQMDLTEPIQLLKLLKEHNVAAVNISCGSPYYNPHIMRPAIFPPSDGYQPPEDPLIGVARQINAAKTCKAAVPDLPMVGTGYTYLQDYLAQVAQAVVRKGWIDSVGLGRMVLSYPDLPADTLAGRTQQRKKVCRTFSDCTTAPRNGIISGCFPLDAYYKEMEVAKHLKEAKAKM